MSFRISGNQQEEFLPAINAITIESIGSASANVATLVTWNSTTTSGGEVSAEYHAANTVNYVPASPEEYNSEIVQKILKLRDEKPVAEFASPDELMAWLDNSEK